MLSYEYDTKYVVCVSNNMIYNLHQLCKSHPQFYYSNVAWAAANKKRAYNLLWRYPTVSEVKTNSIDQTLNQYCLPKQVYSCSSSSKIFESINEASNWFGVNLRHAINVSGICKGVRWRKLDPIECEIYWLQKYKLFTPSYNSLCTILKFTPPKIDTQKETTSLNQICLADQVKGADGKYFYLYKIQNNINKKIYIGVHSTYNLNDGYRGSGVVLNKVYKKYSLNNFTKYILEFFSSYQTMMKREKEIVNIEFLQRDDVYNLTLGGLTPLFTEETIKKRYELNSKTRIVLETGEIFHDGRDFKRKTGFFPTSVPQALAGRTTNGLHLYPYSPELLDPVLRQNKIAELETKIKNVRSEANKKRRRVYKCLETGFVGYLADIAKHINCHPSTIQCKVLGPNGRLIKGKTIVYAD